MLSEKQFNNYLNVVINAIDAGDNHHDDLSVKTFNDHGRWALHQLEVKCSDEKRQNIRRWLNGKECVCDNPTTGEHECRMIGYDCAALYRFLVYCDKLDRGEEPDEVFVEFLMDLIRASLF